MTRHRPSCVVEGDVFNDDLQNPNDPVEIAQAFWTDVKSWVADGYLPVVEVMMDDTTTVHVDLEDGTITKETHDDEVHPGR